MRETFKSLKSCLTCEKVTFLAGIFESNSMLNEPFWTYENFAFIERFIAAYSFNNFFQWNWAQLFHTSIRKFLPKFEKDNFLKKKYRRWNRYQKLNFFCWIFFRQRPIFDRFSKFLTIGIEFIDVKNSQTKMAFGRRCKIFQTR